MGVVSHPGDMSVGANEHGGGSRDRADNGKLPNADVFGVDQLNPIRPWSPAQPWAARLELGLLPPPVPPRRGAAETRSFPALS
jgi:hypothetical protein